MDGRFVDGRGRRVEVIEFDVGNGPEAWIRVSWRGILLGPTNGLGRGYYRRIEDALAQVDIDTLVEVLDLSRLAVTTRLRYVA